MTTSYLREPNGTSWTLEATSVPALPLGCDKGGKCPTWLRQRLSPIGHLDRHIQILGRLFGTTNHNCNRTELIVLITPRVITSSEEAKQVTDECQRKFESLSPLRPHNAG